MDWRKRLFGSDVPKVEMWSTTSCSMEEKRFVSKVYKFFPMTLEQIPPCHYLDPPWNMIAKVPTVQLIRTAEQFVGRSMTQTFIMNDFIKYHPKDNPNEYAYIHQIMERNEFQPDYSSILIPALCAYASADAIFNNALLSSPMMNSPPIEKSALRNPYVKLLIRRHFIAGSLEIGKHFYGYIIVLPEKGTNGYILIMNPLGASYREGKALHGQIPSQVQTKIENLAMNIMLLRREDGVMEKTAPLPKLKVVAVTHPPHATQILDGTENADFACSFWVSILLTYWIWAYTHCGTSDQFVKYLDQLLDIPGGSYNFNYLKFFNEEVDRHVTISNLRRYTLLCMQYYAQILDLKMLLEDGTKDETMDEVLSSEPLACLRFLAHKQKKYPKYVIAGDIQAGQHYRELKRNFQACRTSEDQQKYLETLPIIDLVRLSLQKLEEQNSDPNEFIHDTMLLDEGSFINKKIFELDTSTFVKVPIFLLKDDALANIDRYQSGKASSAGASGSIVVILDDK